MRKKIYFNGDIITMTSNSNIEAILVDKDKISKVGLCEEILKLKDSDTEVIDLKGKIIMPSFIDPHSHFSAFAKSLGLIQLGSISTIDELMEKMKENKRERNLSKEEWIVGFGYDNNNFPNKEHLTKNTLDKISKTHPVMITHASGHIGVVNSLGLKKLGITKETPDPEGGVIGRVQGSTEPNGYLEENAFMKFTSKIDKSSLETLIEQLKEAQNIYLSYGITTAQEGLMKDSEFNLLKFFSSINELKIDLIGYVDIKNSRCLLNEHKAYVKKYVNRFKIGGYKLFLDGSPQGKTAWLSKPYECSGNYSGYPIYKNNEVKEFVKISLDENIQLITHCNGDAAAEQLIDSFKDNLCKDESAIKTRPVMIHAQTVRADQLEEMAKLNMIASFFIAHTYYWGDIHIVNLGKERAFRISPAKTAIEKGVIYTFHQDTPVIPPNMLETIWCAVNRISKDGVIIGKDECISPLDALKGVTINAAYQYFEEGIKGSIEEGKLADLIILDKNPLKVNPMDIKNIKVIETIKEGKTLFRI